MITKLKIYEICQTVVPRLENILNIKVQSKNKKIETISKSNKSIDYSHSNNNSYHYSKDMKKHENSEFEKEFQKAIKKL